MKTLNKYSKTITQDETQPAAQAMLYGIGLTEEDMQKAQVGIVSTGKEGVEKAFNKKLSNRFDIHRTRTGFENDGIDTFENMALKGIWVIDRVVQEEMKGGIDLKSNVWYIPENVSTSIKGK